MIVNKKLLDFICFIDDKIQDNISSSEFWCERILNWEPFNDPSYLETFLGDDLKKEIIFNTPNLNEEDVDEDFLNTYLIPAINEVDSNWYSNNPYLKNIKIKDVRFKKYILGHIDYEPYELFPLDDVKYDEKTFIELHQIGYFKQKVSYPYIGTKDSIWMSVNPNEIKTMQPHIDRVNGNVLVLGLGLGYFAYMSSLKEDVKSITIIELDQDIIDLFNKEILPQFKHKEKIRIIKDDALKYLGKSSSDGFDCVFADIWHDNIDGMIPFLKLKEIEKKNHIPFYYWLNESMILMVRRFILTILVEHIENPNPRYDIEKTVFDKAINRIYKKISELRIDSEDDVLNLIKRETIEKILLK